MTEQVTRDAATALPEPGVTGTAQQDGAAAAEALIAEELLVEDVSIDGMCGVY